MTPSKIEMKLSKKEVEELTRKLASEDNTLGEELSRKLSSWLEPSDKGEIKAPTGSLSTSSIYGTTLSSGVDPYSGSPWSAPVPTPPKYPWEASYGKSPVPGEDLEESIRKLKSLLDAAEKIKNAESKPEGEDDDDFGYRMARFRERAASSSFTETLASLSQVLAHYHDFLTDNGFSDSNAQELVISLSDKLLEEWLS